MIKLKGYDGILFVGDPHLSFLRAGRRTDAHLGTTILGKIEQCVNIALERNLYLIFLGDLFDLKEEQNFEMVTKLMRILKPLRDIPATVEGNHEKTQAVLSDDVALMCMVEAGTIHAMGKNKLWGQIEIGDQIYYIGSTPYGQHLPEKVRLPAKAKPGPIIWLSHDSLDFGKSYPGIQQVEEIEGVSMLVNGHIHDTLPSKKVGNMKAHNPGNITRQSIDHRNHEPAVWQWKPEQDFDLVKIPLVYEKDVFNMTGYHVKAEAPEFEIPEEITVQSTTAFVESMEMLQQDPTKSKEGVYMQEAIKTFSHVTNAPPKLTQKILTFLEAVTIKKEIEEQ